MKTILERRSVRWGFGRGKPPRSTVDQILAAGLAAPSSKNAQPWRLHVVDKHELLQEIALIVKGQEDLEQYVPADPLTGRPHDRFRSTVVESAEVLEQVPLGIFIENLGEFSASREAMIQATPESLSSAIVGFSLEYLGLGGAIQNMWLAAVDLGLAGVFMGDILVAEGPIRDLLGFRGDVVGVLALGYSDVSPGPVEFADADTRVVRHH